MTETSNTKEELRRVLKAYRKSLSEESYSYLSRLILEKLRELREFQEACRIHCYVSITERREVDTRPLLKYMLSDNKEVVVPRTNIDSNTLSHFTIESMDELVLNEWGVPEPKDGRTVEPYTLDLVIVPMLGADRQGNRLGYGKGFYDRFLKKVKCPKIGLTYDECVIEEGLPVESFDVPLNKVVTEKRVIG